MLLQSLVNKNSNKQLQYARMLSGFSPVFSQFGTDIYVSDIVQMCIDVIATEISKLQPRHIRTDGKGIQTIPKSEINRLFKFKPNPLMTTRDFLEKIIWLLYMNYNCFIYPTYEQAIDPNSGSLATAFTGFYPLNPHTASFLQDSTGKLFVKLQFSSGDEITLPYSDIIHLRKKFSVNEIMGGGVTGQPDNTALLSVLDINDTVLSGLGKAVKTSLTVRGILKINTLLDDEKQQAERTAFEAKLNAGDTGVLPMDLKGEYIDLKPDPKLIDKDTMEFLQNKVLNWYGVSTPILSGDYDDDQYQAFYEKTLEPVLIGLEQSFSSAIFTPRQLDVGNEIVFYQRNMMYLSTKTKLELLKTVGEQGLLSDDQKLALLGYPPLDDGSGSRRTMSLNYIDVKLVNEYQLKQAKASKTN